MSPFRSLRLMADDMTGALDSAAGLVGMFGALDVGTSLGEGTISVFDTGTRELAADAAARRVAGSAAHLAPAAGRLCFFKVDSLLRGNGAAELAALLATLAFERVVIAPAMPFQGRVTRAGRQHVRDGAQWLPTGEDLATRLGALGRAVRLVARSAALPSGIVLCDAETDADLDAIVEAGLRLAGSTLWVGAGGLAAALARSGGPAHGVAPALSGPVLGLVGSHHPAMQAQLAHVGHVTLTIEDGGAATARKVQDGLARNGAAFLQVALPQGSGRAEAQARIEAVFADLVARLPRPGLLFASGGETLRALLPPLGAKRLSVVGEMEPGAPVSRLRGGRWAETMVLSKSGAFGSPDFLERLMITLNPLKATRA